MSKPVLLSAGNGKVQEVAGSAPGQVLTWSEAGEWFPGSSGGSGGGGAVFYLNSATAAASPTGNVPGGAGGATAYFAPAQTSKTFTATASTRLSPPTGHLPHDGSWAIVQGFLSTEALGMTSIPAGLWDFNIWAQASTGAGATQTQFRIKVGVYDGTNAPTILFTSDDVYIYDPTVAAQYAVSVVIGSNTISATDRLYIEIDARASANNRTATFYFGGVQPSHVHTTIIVPVNLETEVTGVLQVANGGTGASTLTGYVKASGTADMTASATIPVADVDGAAPLASPTFTGAPDLPTGTIGVTQSAGNNTTALATTAFVTTAVAAAAGSPYDVAGEYVGKPPVSTVLMRFVANRSWTLKSSLVRASCTAFPTGSNAVATVSIAGSNLTNGTITWTTGSTVTVGSFTDTTITAGQVVVLTLTTADSGTTFENPFFTLGGVVA
jgi:hypothetical protein